MALGMLAAVPVAGIAAWLLSTRRSQGHAGAVMALAAWLVTLLGLEPLWTAWDTRGLVALLLLAKIGDTAGYYAGNAFGRRHPFPTISPGKTVEGCLASLLAGTATGAAAVALGLLPSAPHGWLGGLAAGAAINLAAQVGDLLESWVKRRTGVKDSGTWFGPAGGVLDQVDSLLLAIPVALCLWPRLFALPAP